MSLFKNYATDSAKEANGVTVPVGTNDDGTEISFVIARLGGGNKAYAKALEAAQKPYRRQIQLKTMDTELHEKIFREVFASTIIKGWSNVRDADEKEISFTSKNAAMLLEKLPNLYDDLFAQSQNLELFRSDTVEEDEKN